MREQEKDNEAFHSGKVCARWSNDAVLSMCGFEVGRHEAGSCREVAESVYRQHTFAAQDRQLRV